MGTLFFDTETTDKYDFKKSHTDPSQPGIIEFAAIFDDSARRTRAVVNLICDPGCEITAPALAIHGLGPQVINSCAVPVKLLLASFAHLRNRSKTIVAHSLDFDLNLLRTAFHRNSYNFPELDGLEQVCTMKSTANILKLPGVYQGSYKWPTLDEAYRFFVDENGFEGAHGALADAQACRAVYYAKLDRETP